MSAARSGTGEQAARAKVAAWSECMEAQMTAMFG
jgi:hypothetical protein